MLSNVIKGMRNVATIVAFDLMAWPGIGCLIVMPYESKLYLRTPGACSPSSRPVSVAGAGLCVRAA